MKATEEKSCCCVMEDCVSLGESGSNGTRFQALKYLLYAVLGIGVGAAIHGYVPEGFMASIMGRGAWWSVPAVVVIGIPSLPFSGWSVSASSSSDICSTC